MPPHLWNPIILKNFGKWGCIDSSNGKFKSNNGLKVLETNIMCPYYPWDKKRINENVNLSDAVGIHYWNNYKKINKIQLDSLDTAQTFEFDE